MHWRISEQTRLLVSSEAWTRLAWRSWLVFPNANYAYILVRLVLACTVFKFFVKMRFSILCWYLNLFLYKKINNIFFNIPLFFMKDAKNLACENIHFSSLFAAGDVWRGGTSATQWQKFHTDDPNQCLHNKSGGHGVPNINLSNFRCLLVDFGKMVCSSANKLQQNSNASSREDCIPQILTVLLEILRVYIWPLWPLAFCLSFVNNS